MIVNPEQVIGLKFEPYRTVTNLQKYILYSLCIGFGQDFILGNDYKYSYEGHKQFTIF